MAKDEPSALRTYIDEVGDLPPDTLLGRLALVTITEEKVRRDDVVAWFADLGLDETMLPAANKAVDAFKKATSDTKDSYPLAKGRVATLMCRDVTSNADYIKRQITREVRDGDRRKLDYDGGLGSGGEAIGITFYRATSFDNQASARLTVSVNPRLSPSEQPLVRQVARSIKERYDDYLSYLDAQKIRYMVRGYLKKLNAIEVKGGVYFVHSSRDEELGRLSELVNRLGGDCMMHQIPIPDRDRDRAFIVRTFEREAAQSLQDLTKEINEILGNTDAVTPSTYRRLKSRFDEVASNAEEHTLTLQISQDSTSASAEIALDALTELADRMVSE
jgi:hypothetical protein